MAEHSYTNTKQKSEFTLIAFIVSVTISRWLFIRRDEGTGLIRRLTTDVLRFVVCGEVYVLVEECHH